jgi:hypothetical protein
MYVIKHMGAPLPEDVIQGRPNEATRELPARLYVRGNEGNVVHLSRRIERPKTRRKIERFERETPEQFEKRAARIAELEIELGIM